MAITKTKFINYLRCPRYSALDDINENELESDVSLSQYREEEQEEKLKELYGMMYDDSGNDILTVKDEQLEVMLPYYNEIEVLAGNVASKYFPGTFKFAYNTKDQESFDCKINGIRYLCYVDIYNEVDDYFNIIEVKATTSKKFLDMGYTENKEFQPLFENINGIYHVSSNLSEKGLKIKQKLFDRFDKSGHYVYDLAVQRYIIENDLKQNNQESKIDKIKYYLAVLNKDYVFEGKFEGVKPIYDKDANGNEIITFFDLTDITKEYMDLISLDRAKVERYIRELDASYVPINYYCEKKKTTKCKYVPICWKNIPNKNSIFNYLDAHHGFKDGEGHKHDCYELVSDGIINLVDMPDNYLEREKNIIQKQVTKTHIPYFNKEKIKAGIAQITYPIYHLDFESFPCPLPRFRGEKCYSQSVFQFSLHIEKEEGVCDKINDHYGYLAVNTDDHRLELVEEMIKYIKLDKGTILVYNDSFEKTRLKELSEIFPQYKKELLRMRDMVFDLMNITKTRSSLYEELGFNKEEASLFNYYHEDMTGSFSIKKILPLFSNLTYKGMEIANGVEALVTYAKFPKMTQVEYEYKYQKLVEYCRQDTWAMVEILKGLRKSVN